MQRSRAHTQNPSGRLFEIEIALLLATVYNHFICLEQPERERHTSLRKKSRACGKEVLFWLIHTIFGAT